MAIFNKLGVLLASAKNVGLDLHFNTNNLAEALLLMLLGMVGIFVVMLVIMLSVKLLNKFAKDKDDKK